MRPMKKAEDTGKVMAGAAGGENNNGNDGS